MTHKEVLECGSRKLAEYYLLGELKPADAREFESHLCVCRECAGDMSALRISKANQAAAFAERAAGAALPARKSIWQRLFLSLTRVK
jgi:anti-sigma factor RsiW